MPPFGGSPYSPGAEDRYDYRPGSAITDLILRAGDVRARQQERSGEIWGQTVAGLGQMAGQALGDYQQRKEEEAKQSARSEAIDRLFSSPDPPDPREIIKIYGPKDGADVIKALGALDPSASLSYKDKMEQARDTALGVKAQPADKRPAAYAFARNRLIANKVFRPEEIPEQYDETFLDMTASYGGAPKRQTFSPGEGFIDESGQTQVPIPAVEKAPNLQHVETAEGIRSFNPATGEIGPVIARGKPTQAAMPSFQSKEVLDDQGRPVMANFDARSGQYIDATTGQAIKNPRPVPSATESAEARKFQNAAPVLKSMEELSEKINTLQGLKAKAVGEKAKLEAELNLNDNVAEYEALISGFTPLVARSLGHTGVLTEQDVQSVKALFPKPGDSKSLRDRKVARVKSIIGDLGGTATETGPMRLKYNPATGKLE